MKDRAAPLHPRIYRVPPGLSSTKTFVNVGTAAVNGTEISRKSFQIFWKLLNFRIANHSTDSHLEIPGAKLNEKKKPPGKSFRKFGYTSRGRPLFQNFGNCCATRQTRYWKLSKIHTRLFG